jgi:predicted amidophosphoribosyltransferase
LCFACAPDLEVELAAEQSQATVEQMTEKVRAQDLTKDLDLTSEAAGLCPACGARTQGAKFCPECGKPLRPKSECSRCGMKVEAGTKFCPECGNKMA